MFIEHTTNDAVIGNSGKGKSFSISASAKAFKVLSSNIYKNKIRAVVRELVCNAVDAHVLNQQTKPYQIKAPNDLDQRFVVRDFGPGLSHEDMVELYTTYFASTKAERNDQIGALGLGSKSPFSYTSTFSVISYFEGMVRVYHCMLSEGEPSIVKTHEEPFKEGDEPGIEVIVPVKQDDISSFAREISYIMRPFKSGSYTILGNANIEVDSFDLREDYKNEWFGARQSDHPTGLHAVYGNIVYPLNGIDGVDAEWLKYAYNTVYVHFPLGELDIQPSREELSLDEHTVANIIKRVNRLSEEAKAKDIAYLNTITSNRELARQLHYELSWNRVEYLKRNNHMFNGMTIEDLTAGEDLTELVKSLRWGRMYECVLGKPAIRYPIYYQGWGRKPISNVHVSSIYSYGRKRAFILIEDCKKNIRTTMNGLWLSQDPNHPSVDEYIFVINEQDERTEEAVKQIKIVMGDDEVITLRSSELEDIRKLVNGYGVKKKREYAPRPTSPNAVRYVLNEKTRDYSAEQLFLSLTDLDDLEGFVVGQYRDHMCVMSDEFNHAEGMTISCCKQIAYQMDVKEFVAVRPSTFKRVLKNENIECLLKPMYENLIELCNSVKAEDYFYIDSNTRGAARINEAPALQFLLPQLTSTRDPKAKELNKVINLMSGARLSTLTKLAESVNTASTTYNANIESAKDRFAANWVKFTRERFMVATYLNSLYSPLKPKRAEEVARQYKLIYGN